MTHIMGIPPASCYSPARTGISSPVSSPSRYSDIDGGSTPDAEVILAVRRPLGPTKTGSSLRRSKSEGNRAVALHAAPSPITDEWHTGRCHLSTGDFHLSTADFLMNTEDFQASTGDPHMSTGDFHLSTGFTVTPEIHAAPNKVSRVLRRLRGLFRTSAKHSAAAAEPTANPGNHAGAARNADQSQMHLNRLLVHSDLLSHYSSYFARELRRASQLQGGAQRTVLVVEVDAKDVVLMRELISFIYTQQLPPGLDASCLIQFALLADKYEMESCLEACIQRLALVLQMKPDVQHVVAALHLPNQVRSATKLTDLTSIAVSCIKGYLMDLERAWEREELRKAFVTLPYEVVQVLLESPQLAVASENTALMAVCSWLYHNCDCAQEDADGSGQEKAAVLLATLRFTHLTHSFLSQVAMLLPWVTGSRVGHRCLVEALQYSAASSMMRRALEEARAAQPAGRLLQRAASKRKRLKFNTCLMLQDLQAAAAVADAQDAPQVVTSRPHFFQGCWLRFQIEVAPAARMHPQRGRLYGGLHWTLGLHPPELAHALEGLDDVQIRLVFEVQVGSQASQQVVHSHIGKQLAAHNQCIGWPELLHSPDPQSWSQYATTEGKVGIKVVAYECE